MNTYNSPTHSPNNLDTFNFTRTSCRYKMSPYPWASASHSCRFCTPCLTSSTELCTARTILRSEESIGWIDTQKSRPPHSQRSGQTSIWNLIRDSIRLLGLRNNNTIVVTVVHKMYCNIQGLACTAWEALKFTKFLLTYLDERGGLIGTTCKHYMIGTSGSPRREYLQTAILLLGHDPCDWSVDRWSRSSCANNVLRFSLDVIEFHWTLFED